MAPIASRCSAVARSSTTNADRPIPLPIASGVRPEDDEAEAIERHLTVLSRYDLKRHRKLARSLSGLSKAGR